MQESPAQSRTKPPTTLPSPLRPPGHHSIPSRRIPPWGLGLPLSPSSPTFSLVPLWPHTDASTGKFPAICMWQSHNAGFLCQAHSTLCPPTSRAPGSHLSSSCCCSEGPDHPSPRVPTPQSLHSLTPVSQPSSPYASLAPVTSRREGREALSAVSLRSSPDHGSQGPNNQSFPIGLTSSTITITFAHPTSTDHPPRHVHYHLTPAALLCPRLCSHSLPNSMCSLPISPWGLPPPTR